MANDYFFIVGAQRSGTTYLYHLLAEHPEVEMAKPLRPEPKFFITDHLYSRGLGYYKSHYFEEKSDAWLRGEKSTSYLELEKAAQRIAASFPNAKIMTVLRNPIERAISNYRFSVNNGFETATIEDAFLNEEERRLNYDSERVSVSPYAYLRRGRYKDYILMYQRYFPPERIKVVLHEELHCSMDVIQDVYTFLDVANDFSPDAFQKVFNSEEKVDDYPLSAELCNYLKNYFFESNTWVAEQFDFDLKKWGWTGEHNR